VADLTVELAGITLRNPLLLASGIWGETGASMAAIYSAGAGGVVTKSIGSEPRPGYLNPTVEPLGATAFLNAMGLPNPGIDAYPAEIAIARASGAIVIGSIFGATAREFARLAVRMASTGVAALELNLSCPHARGYGSEIGSDPRLVEKIVAGVVRAVEIPVFAKITPNTADPAGLARAAERAGAHGISAINTVRALAIDTTLGRPILAHGMGGLSGPAIKPIGLACVWQIFEAVRIPILGIGGIATADDAIEYLYAGARALQIGTALSGEGASLFGRLAREISTRLDELGMDRWEEGVGRAHPPRSIDDPPPAKTPERRRGAPPRGKR
jgi:dihydroorotate dehydrogenase (NAD+) catalytic subunit